MKKIEMWYDDVEDECTNRSTIEIGDNEDPVEAALNWFDKLIKNNPNFDAAGALLSDLEVINEKVDGKTVKIYYLRWSGGKIRVTVENADEKIIDRYCRQFPGPKKQ